MELHAVSITTISSREFNQDASGAKRAAQNGPIFITDRGRPAHVLMTIDEYRRLSASAGSIVDLLGMTRSIEIDFEPPTLAAELYRPADLS
jgi:prevent-host-death family protein